MAYSHQSPITLVTREDAPTLHYLIALSEPPMVSQLQFWPNITSLAIQ
jgi:hypothetical protein